jgi:hypothetical protein
VIARRSSIVTILFSIFLFFHASPAFAQFDAGFSSLPLEGGARNEGTFSYQWHENFATSFRGVIERTATNDEVDGFPDSLLYTEERLTDLAIFPVEYAFELTTLDLAIGVGASFNRRKVLEKGNFVFSDPQVFNNEYVADRYGATIRADIRGEIAPVTFQYATSLVPLYLFSFRQDISIQPLVSEEASSDTTATGGFAWEQTAKIGLWRLLQLEATYDIDVLSFDILNLSADGSQFVFETGESDTLVQTFRGFLNLLIPVGEESGFSVGGGFQHSVVEDRAAENSGALEESRWIYKLEYGRQL